MRLSSTGCWRSSLNVHGLDRIGIPRRARIVVALYERRFFMEFNEIPAVIDRRYSAFDTL